MAAMLGEKSPTKVYITFRSQVCLGWTQAPKKTKRCFVFEKGPLASIPVLPHSSQLQCVILGPTGVKSKPLKNKLEADFSSQNVI